MLLDEDDDVLLSDFGTATIAQNTMTQDPQAMAGTIYYTAPEQLKGRATYASDQYSLAMVIFEWLSGKRPFRGSFGEVMSQHVLAAPPHLQSFVPAIPPVVDDVIQIALQKEPKDRFSSIQAFATAFLQASSGKGAAITHPIPVLSTATELLPDDQLEDNTFLLTPSHKQLITPRFDEDDELDLTPATNRFSPAGRGVEHLPAGVVPTGSEVEYLPTNVVPAGSGNASVIIAPAIGGDVIATSVTEPNTFIPVPATTTTNPIAPIAAPAGGKRRMTRRAAMVGAAAVVVAAAGGLTWLELTHKITPFLTIDGHGITPTPTPNASQRATLYTYQNHSGPVNALQWSLDSTRVASGSGDHTVQIWDALTGDQRVTLSGHKATVLCLSWLHSGASIASGSKDTTVRLWNTSNGANTFIFYHSLEVNGVAGSPDGTSIASVSYNVAHVWRTNGDRITIYHGRTDGIKTVAWSPDGKRIATGNQNTMIKVWNASNGNDIYLTYGGHSAAVKTLAWMPSPSGSLIASGSEDGQVRVWNALNGKDVTIYQGHSDHVNSIAWSPDGVLIASASTDRTVQVWNAKTGTRIFKYSNHQSPINAVAWSPDGQYLASGGEDKIVHVWKLPGR